MESKTGITEKTYFPARNDFVHMHKLVLYKMKRVSHCDGRRAMIWYYVFITIMVKKKKKKIYPCSFSVFGYLVDIIILFTRIPWRPDFGSALANAVDNETLTFKSYFADRVCGERNMTCCLRIHAQTYYFNLSLLLLSSRPVIVFYDNYTNIQRAVRSSRAACWPKVCKLDTVYAVFGLAGYRRESIKLRTDRRVTFGDWTQYKRTSTYSRQSRYLSWTTRRTVC